MPRPNFYIPRIDLWNWRLISFTFVDVQLKRAQESYAQTDNALAILDEDVSKIEQEIKGVWATANVQMMRAFQARLKEVGAERKRIGYVRLKLRGVIDRMNIEIERSKTHASENVQSQVVERPRRYIHLSRRNTR